MAISTPPLGHACPCCGFLTIGKSGNFEICPVCVWEDDPAQSADAEFTDGANWGTCLRKARDTFKLTGASDPHWIADARPPKPNERP